MKCNILQLGIKVPGSLPTWERGLKFSGYLWAPHTPGVAPHVGAWIEIITPTTNLMTKDVAPHVGAWIEIVNGMASALDGVSLPTWERGLKWLWDT